MLAEEAGRLLLSFYNTTTTVSASYGLVIILGISFVLLVLLSAVYAAAASLFTRKPTPFWFWVWFGSLAVGRFGKWRSFRSQQRPSLRR